MATGWQNGARKQGERRFHPWPFLFIHGYILFDYIDKRRKKQDGISCAYADWSGNKFDVVVMWRRQTLFASLLHYYYYYYNCFLLLASSLANGLEQYAISIKPCTLSASPLTLLWSSVVFVVKIYLFSYIHTHTRTQLKNDWIRISSEGRRKERKRRSRQEKVCWLSGIARVFSHMMM